MKRNSQAVLRPARADDVRAVLGEVPQTMRAWVIDRDGEILAMGILANMDGQDILFSHVTEEIRAMPLTLAKLFKQGMKFIRKTAFAIADKDYPNSGKFLEWLGFEYWGSAPEGEVYRWVNTRK